MREMKGRVFALAALAALLVAGEAPGEPSAKSGFKTTGVTLYDCGLAQLEKQTTVNGARRLSIGVTLAHLDDLLASLVVATDGTVRVTGVNYPSVRNLGQAIEASGMANAMSTDGTALTMPADVPGYLEALVGMSVVVDRRKGRTIRGTVLACADDREPDMEPVGATAEGTTAGPIPRRRALVLVSPGGAVSWIPVDEIDTVAPVSAREAAAVSDFATQLGKSNGFTETEVELVTSGGSKGRLAASFIRQIPLWRTVYKVTARKDKVTMEAWAVVHNDTTEDWEGVEMTLVSGLPKSYVLSVASPRYQHRETLILEGEGAMMPQLGSRTADSLLYDFAGLIIGESYGSGGLGMMGYGVGGGGSGSGYGRGAAGYSQGAIASEASSSILDVGEPAAAEQAQPQVEGEISTYRALNKVSVPARTSSLVPLIRRDLEGGAFTLLEQGSSPATCVRVKNDTGLVLQGGISSFYVGGRFRGQAQLFRTEPGDIGVWCFGEDPDVSFDRTEKVVHTHEALEWRGGQLWSHNVKRTTFDYTVENMAGQDRRIALDVRHIENGRIVTPEAVVDADLDNRKLHLFEVAARSEIEKRVVIEEGVMTPVGADAASLEDMTGWKGLPREQTDVLRSAVSALERKAELEEALAEEGKEKGRDEARAASLKETLEAVPATRGRSRMVEKILRELMEVQERIAKRDRSIETLTNRIALAQAAAAELLEGLKPAVPR